MELEEKKLEVANRILGICGHGVKANAEASEAPEIIYVILEGKVSNKTIDQLTKAMSEAIGLGMQLRCHFQHPTVRRKISKFMQANNIETDLV